MWEAQSTVVFFSFKGGFCLHVGDLMLALRLSNVQGMAMEGKKKLKPMNIDDDKRPQNLLSRWEWVTGKVTEWK